MIKVELTKHLAGVAISGTRFDFQSIVKACHLNCDADKYGDKEFAQEWVDMETKTLSLCPGFMTAGLVGPDPLVSTEKYSVEGDGEERHDNLKKVSDRFVGEQALIYRCNVLYPEICYSMLALNFFIRNKALLLAEKTSGLPDMFDRRVVWDWSISVIRDLQAAFAECMQGFFDPADFAKWLGMMNDYSCRLERMHTQYMDKLSAVFLKTSGDQRKEYFLKIPLGIVKYKSNNKYKKMLRILGVRSMRRRIPFQEIDYMPDDSEYRLAQDDERW
ncbi:MAG: hypothetical protein LBO05_00035 [Deltaproteobacteria bacterium]|jgi:hypothetical protein|nr:hypothetical protein [Deltaproteobacteria bacterium]